MFSLKLNVYFGQLSVVIIVANAGVICVCVMRWLDRIHNLMMSLLRVTAGTLREEAILSLHVKVVVLMCFAFTLDLFFCDIYCKRRAIINKGSWMGANSTNSETMNTFLCANMRTLNMVRLLILHLWDKNQTGYATKVRLSCWVKSLWAALLLLLGALLYGNDGKSTWFPECIVWCTTINVKKKRLNKLIQLKIDVST